MKFVIKILALFLTLSMLLSFCSVFAFADDYTSGGGIGSFGDYFAAVLAQFGRDISGTSTLGSVVGFLAKGIAGSVCGDVCSLSDDGLHHCSYVSPDIESNRDSHGWYATLPCDYCGKKFNAYSKDFDDSYKAFGDDLPANMYSSSGTFLYHVPLNLLVLAIGIPGMTEHIDFASFSFSGSGTYLSESSYGPLVITALSPFSFLCTSSSTIQISLRTVSHPLPFSKFSIYSAGGFTSGSSSMNYSVGVYFSDSRCILFGSPPMKFSLPSPVIYESPIVSVSVDVSQHNLYVHNTRIGSVNFNLATKQGDNITNVYQDVTIVNEETNVYTDPTTGTQQNIKSWTYDYTTRTYHLTLEDGSLLDVEFGDNSIQVKLNGEITQEYYYTVEKEAEPTPTPEVPPTTEPEVTPAPDPGTGPTPTPGPGSPGGGDDDNSFFDWLKQWLIDFKTWLAEKFDALGAGDVSAGDTNITIEGDTTNDVDIHYTDQSGEEKETSLLSLIHKFGFLHDIYDIGRTLFSLVATDASAAYAFDPDSPLPMGADDGPAANGAPTLTLDLGVAQSVYGWDYGGEVQILDLSWYTPYKETVDNIMSGFLWLLFAWGLFKQAPSIISGGGIIANKSEDISDGKRGR